MDRWLPWIHRINGSQTDWFRRKFKRPDTDASYSSSAGLQGESNSVPVLPPSSAVSSATCCPPRPRALSSAARWTRAFDVCVCHSADDSPDARHLASYLESAPCGLRCFLPLRDSLPGTAVPTELCEAVQASHCWVLLITPLFLSDPWCRYQMNQALTEAPISNRIIPLLLRATRSDYPPELRFYYYIDLNREAKQGYERLYKTVLNYLEEISKNTAMDDHVSYRTNQGDHASSGHSLTDPWISGTLNSSMHLTTPSRSTTECEIPEPEQGHML
ncbi:hypothetical protein JZ751_002006 [Albula glossodonta]|uniref:TIR domain-containing protein n=1 Tax=Albula glossodonta TaxID=121402 RepID=A0A8T2PAM6_9TELE|nr:hypothetical protein JZ751_002006 [Albula glossodonta]